MEKELKNELMWATEREYGRGRTYPSMHRRMLMIESAEQMPRFTQTVCMEYCEPQLMVSTATQTISDRGGD